jgi:DNA-binding PadR family transcriptional regulator
MANTPRPEAFLPLKPVVFQVLLTLAGGGRHGYAIAQDIGQRTSARRRLRPGNLYRALHTMLDDGLIEETDTAGPTDDSRRRQYRITQLGRRVASAEAQRLRSLVLDARAARVLKSGGRV